MDKVSLYKKFIKKLNETLERDAEIPEDEHEIEDLLNEIKRIKIENQELNYAIEASADSIHIADGNGNILRVNRIFENHTGYKRQDIIGRNVADVESAKIYHPSVVKLVLKEKRKLTMMQTAYGREGESMDVITTSVPIFNEDGSVFRVISNARPVRELSLLYEYFGRKDGHKDTAGSDLQSQFLYKSSTMKTLMDLSGYIASAESSILITGESGTGKSFLARFIHNHSNRLKGAFIEINCAAIPENLLESELFGYETGAFTGAKVGGKPGLIELADKGTLFLDEIGDMSFALQAKLLQVIQNKKITRVGGEKTINIDVRIISATNKDLNRLIEEGKFRSDLYYRLNVIPLEMPPLRDRSEDIVPLAEYFVEMFNEKYNKNVAFSSAAMGFILKYPWPGNIRELENLVERLIVVNQTGLVTVKDLPRTMTSYDNLIKPESNNLESVSLKESLEEVEKHLILSAYNKLGSSYQVAKYFGISQSNANRKIKKYLGISDDV